MALKGRKFDVLRATATELADRLAVGNLTSVNLIERYLAQIEAHNHDGVGLRAIASMPSRERLLARAEELDVERQHGKVRGPLHGIPIIVKVGIGPLHARNSEGLHFKGRIHDKA